ncbi:unnamed protein product [Moneuplotes crassus]|uniref:Uncharacterized protein n=1 Tax=Euplotes crassus TaxID=5936 RepID=A0AAD1X4F7_EUPCR|nr:unnamed protein product [Moneuplotes crassus]
MRKRFMSLSSSKCERKVHLLIGFCSKFKAPKFFYSKPSFLSSQNNFHTILVNNYEFRSSLK